MAEIKRYCAKTQGTVNLSADFKVREFASKDGADEVLVAEELVALLQSIRDHFGKPVTINSGYRSKSHNAAVGGTPKSQHLRGTAADIVVRGISPLAVAQFAEYLLGDRGGIGVYPSFTHVDVRENRARWDHRSGREVAVSGWPGYTPESWYAAAGRWAVEHGISDGTRPGEPCTRAEVWEMLRRLDDGEKT